MSGFKILGINHIGLAPKDGSTSANFFTNILGLKHFGDELVASQMTNTRMFASASSSSDHDPRLEILENETGKDGPIAKFLAKKGAGIHHIALSVDSIEAALQHLKKNNVRLIDEQPRPGAHKTRIAFIHPEATGGLLVELVEQS